MAAVLPFPFKQGTVPTAAAAAILTSGAAQNIIIKKAVFTNVTAGALTITVWLVAPAGATATGNILMNNFSIAANSDYVCNELSNQVVSLGATVQAQASAANGINYAISGLSA